MAARRGVSRAVLGVVGVAVLVAAVIPAHGAAPGAGASARGRDAPASVNPSEAPAEAPTVVTVAGAPDPVAWATPAADRAPPRPRPEIDPVREVRRMSAHASTRPPPRSLSIAVTGDVLPHQPVVAAARRADGSYDFRPLLRSLRRPVGRADLALCHLEVPLTRDRSALSGYPVFNAPHEVADALAHLGYDGCSVASNHALDRGVTGVRATLRALDRAGLAHVGTARSRREARRTPVHRVGGARIAHLSYTYGLNGAVVPSDRPWTVNLIDRRRNIADARRARRRGADLVVISLHWGTEYVTAPTAVQRRLAGRLLASPAVDVLVGHHAHVVQPVARRHGKVVVYGLGNLLSNQSAACCNAATQDGVVVRLVVRERRDGSLRVARVEYVPTMVRHPQRRVVVVRRALRRGASGAYAAQLRASLQRTRRAVGGVAVLAD